MSAPTRVFVGRLARLRVFDPLGDQVGRVRDVVVHFSPQRRPRVIGLVVEVPGRRRVFVPMTRVTSVDGGQVITTGLVNMRRFEQRATETLVLSELIERPVLARTENGTVEAVVEDIGIEWERNRDWWITKVFCRERLHRTALGRLRTRSGATFVVGVDAVSGLHITSEEQSVARLLEEFAEFNAADLAEAIADLAPKRRAEVVAALDDDRLADVLAELPEPDQVEIVTSIPVDRAADILEEMEPDDAADLLKDLPPERAEELLTLMEPDEAAPLRRLISYDENTAGGLMTPEPIILGPEASVAEALALVRRSEIQTTIATTVFVCRAPLETPTGRYLGLVHLQRLLREPPHAAVGDFLDRDTEPVQVGASLAQVTRTFATYDLVSVPVVDDQKRLLGAVTVDDVLDHILPDHWRGDRHGVTHG